MLELCLEGRQSGVSGTASSAGTRVSGTELGALPPCRLAEQCESCCPVRQTVGALFRCPAMGCKENPNGATSCCAAGRSCGG